MLFAAGFELAPCLFELPGITFECGASFGKFGRLLVVVGPLFVEARRFISEALAFRFYVRGALLKSGELGLFLVNACLVGCLFVGAALDLLLARIERGLLFGQFPAVLLEFSAAFFDFLSGGARLPGRVLKTGFGSLQLLCPAFDCVGLILDRGLTGVDLLFAVLQRSFRTGDLLKFCLNIRFLARERGGGVVVLRLLLREGLSLALNFGFAVRERGEVGVKCGAVRDNLLLGLTNGIRRGIEFLLFCREFAFPGFLAGRFGGDSLFFRGQLLLEGLELGELPGAFVQF